MTRIFRPLVAVLAMAAFYVPVAGQQVASPLSKATLPESYVPEFGTMWTFDAPPLEYWEARYGFAPDQGWLDDVRLSSVRLPGCSSSFVSGDGLIMTNHHCARSCVAAVAPADTNYLHTGFVAASRAEEKVCPNLYVDQLVGIEDVTARVRGAVTRRDAGERAGQREVVTARLREECEAGTGLRCQVVAFYNGGMYSLYRYRRIGDLRLVMAPELEVAYFGGDPDNFTYPRHDLDVTFLRAYEGDRPLRPERWLRWSAAGAVEGEPVFVVGNPGSTGRLLTVAQMEYLRDVEYPASLETLAMRLRVLRQLAALGPQAARRYENTIFGLANSEKAIGGYLAGLQDEELMARKRAFEQDFHARIAADPALRAKYGRAWQEIAGAQLELATFADQARFYAMNGSSLLATAAEMVRAASQEALHGDQRLPGWTDERIARARQALLRDRTTDPDLERAQLAGWLELARARLGDDPLVRAFLAGRTPAAAAAALVADCELDRNDDRRALVEAGLAAIEASEDPLISVVRAIEPAAAGYARRAAELREVIAANAEELGEAIYAAYGRALPPDATFTLRISDGVVQGYPMNGTIAPYRTSMYGLFARSAEFDHAPPFRLPESWKAAEASLDLRTPMNFVSTNDIIGGNSGSPVVNRAGEVVGLVFDGNIEMLPNRFLFTDDVSRTVSVHSRAIIEALRKVYRAGHIADELEARPR